MASFLIVDDSRFIRFVLRKYLESYGHFVAGEAGYGEIALSMYKELCPDIVILDIALPGQLSGFDALKQIMDFHPHAKVIMCSSESYAGTIIKAMESGAKGFIAKPIDGKVLNDLIVKINK